MPPLPLIPHADRLRTRRVDAQWAEIDGAEALGSINPETLELLKHTDRVAVVRAPIMLGDTPQDVVLKTEPLRLGWGLRGLWHRVRLVLGVTRLDRHWKSAAKLQASGAFPTARCLALFRWHEADRQQYLTLVMEALPGRSLLEWMDQSSSLSVRTQHALARAVGVQTRSMLERGLFNRDHKPSNLIVTALDPPSLALIDVVGVGAAGARAIEPVGPLASLMLEPMGCGVLPRRSLLMRTLKSFEPDPTARRRLLKRVASAVKAHGDPTPKDNPLNP